MDRPWHKETTPHLLARTSAVLCSDFEAGLICFIFLVYEILLPPLNSEGSFGKKRAFFAGGKLCDICGARVLIVCMSVSTERSGS